MGVDVGLVRVHRQGTSPKRRHFEQLDLVIDEGDFLADACLRSRGLPMLSRVKPYGSLVLSSSEMEQFIGEVDVLRERSVDPREQAVLGTVRRLGEACLGDPTCELHLDGD